MIPLRLYCISKGNEPIFAIGHWSTFRGVATPRCDASMRTVAGTASTCRSRMTIAVVSSRSRLLKWTKMNRWADTGLSSGRSTRGRAARDSWFEGFLFHFLCQCVTRGYPRFRGCSICDTV